MASLIGENVVCTSLLHGAGAAQGNEAIVFPFKRRRAVPNVDPGGSVTMWITTESRHQPVLKREVRLPKPITTWFVGVPVADVQVSSAIGVGDGVGVRDEVGRGVWEGVGVGWGGVGVG